MKKFLTTGEGLSMSQAQSISNLVYQESREIDSKLKAINNCSKVVDIEGKSYTKVRGNKIPEDVVALITKKGELHALQAYLMSALKAKEALLEEVKNREFVYDVPEPEFDYSKQMSYAPIERVSTEYGWDSLTEEELLEFTVAEAMAAHIGKFIHDNGILTKLREELPTLESLEFISIKAGEQIPLSVIIHHTPEQLFEIHKTLAEKHREFESKVNYYKAKIKNLVNDKNMEIAAANSAKANDVKVFNAVLKEEYSNSLSKYNLEKAQELALFQKRNLQLKAQYASLKIVIPDYFRKTISDYVVREERC